MREAPDGGELEHIRKSFDVSKQRVALDSPHWVLAPDNLSDCGGYLLCALCSGGRHTKIQESDTLSVERRGSHGSLWIVGITQLGRGADHILSGCRTGAASRGATRARI